jgi:hypothetical protein
VNNAASPKCMRLTMRAGGLGGGPGKKSRVQAKAFFRFDGLFSHQAANASRWAVIDIRVE